MTDKTDAQRTQIRRAMYRVLGSWPAADHLIRSIERANGGHAITTLLAECAKAEPATSRTLAGPCDPTTFGQTAARVATAGSTCDGPDMSRITSYPITIPNWRADHATTQ